MGNVHDALSITVAVLIVLTGEDLALLCGRVPVLTCVQLGLSRRDGLSRVWRPLTSSFLTTVMSFGEWLPGQLDHELIFSRSDNLTPFTY